MINLVPRSRRRDNQSIFNGAAVLGLCVNQGVSGPFFFHGFLRPISRAREIENDEFHGHFTG